MLGQQALLMMNTSFKVKQKKSEDFVFSRFIAIAKNHQRALTMDSRQLSAQIS